MMSAQQITKLTNYRVRLVLKADADMDAVHMQRNSKLYV